MNKKIKIYLVAAILFGLSCELLASSVYSTYGAFKPTFKTKEGEISAGTAFLLKYEGRNFFVTAHHLFGEAGGFSKEYRWKELSKLIDSAEFTSLKSQNRIIATKKIIPIKGAKSVSVWSGSRDIAVFELEEKNEYALPLASRCPNMGERVYLLARVYNKSKDILLHEATMIDCGKKWISYYYNDSSLVLNGTSGAAILNSTGEVIGINLTGYERDGYLVGEGNPLGSLQEKFEKIIKTP